MKLHVSSRQRQIAFGVAAVLTLVAGVGLAVRSRQAARQQTAGAYYCPMHPTYTSDRPGTCPICNMSLVPKEMDPGEAQHTHDMSAPEGKSGQQQEVAKSFESICYLHNCPKLHEGRPCPMTVVAKPGEKVTCPVCGTRIAEGAKPSANRTVLYWTDPMIPGYKADQPGKSPMGMELVPVYAEDAPAASTEAPDGYAPVMLSPQKRQLIGVKVAPVQRRELSRVIRTVGRIAYDPELYQAQQEYVLALQGLRQAEQAPMPALREQAQQLVDSSTIRLRLMGMNETAIAELAGRQVADRSLLFEDPEQRVWVYATVYEYELPYVSEGQTVYVQVPSLPERAFEGVIRAIDPVLASQSRSARARIVLQDPEGVLKPEMFVDVFIRTGVGTVLAVPTEAVFRTGTKALVFVDRGDGLFEPRDVVLGMAAEGSYEIRQGLAEHEPVVVSGNFLIDSESRLKAALDGISGTDSAGGQHAGH